MNFRQKGIFNNSTGALPTKNPGPQIVGQENNRSRLQN